MVAGGRILIGYERDIHKQEWGKIPQHTISQRFSSTQLQEIKISPSTSHSILKTFRESVQVFAQKGQG